MKTFSRKILAVGCVFVALVILASLPILTIEVTSEAALRFDMDVRMTRVRKILVRTDAVKKIVAMADATLLDQKWQNMSFESEGSLLSGQWQVSGKGQLSIEINDDYLGAQSIRLNQTVDVQPDRLYSTNDLESPSESIREYASTLELVPDSNNQAAIESSLKIKIRTKASLLTRPFVRKEIEASASRSLKRQETAIRELVDEHRNKLIIIPDLNRER